MRDLIHHLLNLEDGKEEDHQVDEQRNVDGNGDEDQLGEGRADKADPPAVQRSK